MRGHREPLSVPERPDIGIAAIPLFAIRCGVAGARVNDSDIAENAHSDFLRREVPDRDRSSGLCQELLLVDERPIRVRAQEVFGEDLLEPLHIAVLHRMDVVAVERGQRFKVACVCLRGTSQRRPTKSLSAKLLAHEDAVIAGLGAASRLFITD